MPEHQVGTREQWLEERVALLEREFTESDGATTVRMTSHGIATEERVDSHREGWRICFDNLDRVLAR